jgi:hypothetical protein
MPLSTNKTTSALENLSYKKLCASLKQAARKKGTNARQLSQLLEKRYPTITEFLNGNLPNPKLDTMETLCEALGFTLSFTLRSKRAVDLPRKKKGTGKNGKNPGK